MTTYAYFVRGEKHAAMCRTSIESVYKADQYADVVVMTDDQSLRFPDVNADVHRFPSGMPIMLANLEAQFRALNIADSATVVFLDTDTLLLRPLETAQDLSITWRDHVKVIEDEKVEGIASAMPYNYGVMISSNTIEALEALIWMRERIRKMHVRHQLWYGNQLALFELAGPRPDEGTRIDKRRIPWSLTHLGNEISIEKLPCEQYNYTPQKADEDVSDKYVLHFKGGSRPLMKDYAQKLGLGWYLDEVTRDAA